MTRQQAEHIIRDVMYGAPGEPYDTDIGRMLINTLLDQMGLSALTDEAVSKLAQSHQWQHEIETRAALRRQHHA